MSEKKSKSKKEVPKKIGLQKIKKPLIGGGIIAAVAIAGIITGVVIFEQLQEEEPVIFIFGAGGGLAVLDPLEFGTFQTFYFLENIAEALFDYEFTSENSRIISNLAYLGTWSNDTLNYTCQLRQGVKFHDGTPFNASAVKWNFDRLYRLRDEIYFEAWLLPDGTPILNNTVVIDDYTIRFVLNKPFVPFEAILGKGPLIVSPSSTPADNFTFFETGNLIATGPFIHNSTDRIWDPIYEEYYSGDSVFLANPDYWGGKPSFDKIIIKVFDNYTLRQEAILSGEIHLTETLEPENYLNNTEITLFESRAPEVNFITMDNEVINKTLRKAISYALDYSLLVPLGKGYSPGCLDTIRCRSPLTKEMLYSNWEDIVVPEYNITKAREIILKGIGPYNSLVAGLTANDTVSAGNQWEMLAENNPIVEYNCSYTVGYDWLKELAFLFHDNLTQIGINVEPVAAINIWAYYSPENQFKLFGWRSDYLDPNNHIYGFYSNASYQNFGNVNDPYLQNLMEVAVQETNKTVREQQYLEIQKYIVEDLCPDILWYTPLYAIPMSLKVRGYNEYNTMKILHKYWYFVE